MLSALLKFSVKYRIFVILGTLALAIPGIYNFQILPIDAVPDITNVQIQINTKARGYTPLEVENRITFPIETALAGTPKLSHTRSISRYGMSQVTVVFDDDTDIYFARQLINTRLQEMIGKLPPNTQPVMGPIATGLGEIFLWTVGPDEKIKSTQPYSLTELRTIQDWIIRPQLRNIPGVADVNSIGGYTKQYQVAPDPEKLRAYKISFRDVVDALMKNNDNVGAGYIEHSGSQYLIRTPGQVSGIRDIERIIAGSRNGIPIYIKDIAEVTLGKELRTGAATENGQEVVLGTVFMLKGENSRTVSIKVADKLKEINRSLPEGVKAKTVYDRTNLVNATLDTMKTNLLEGALLVIVVLFLLLGNFRAAIITALVIPLSMLFAITGMVKNNVSGNLLSLGAIDFGIIIDGAVIIVENCIRRLAEEHKKLGRTLDRDERFGIVAYATKEVSRPSIFGGFIIMIVYLPILTLTGIEGKMFQPMAFTVLAALTGAMLLSVTFVPAMVAQFSSGNISEQENLLVKLSRKVYEPLLGMSLNNRPTIITLAGVLVILSLLLSTRMGSEFLPTLDERDLAIHALRVPGTSLSQAVSMQDLLEKKIMELPEVDYVFAKIGTGDIATDPMPPSVADVYAMIKPRSEWPDPKRPKSDFIAELENKMNEVPGNKYEIIQPIEMRFNELIAGVRSDVAVKVFGDDLDMLVSHAKRIEQVLSQIPGAADVDVEQVTGLPVLTLELDRELMARLGINVSTVQDAISIAIGGETAGEVFEGDRRFQIMVRLSEDIRTNIESLKRIPITLPDNFAPATILGSGHNLNHIPLSTVAKFSMVKGPNQISRENGKRRIVVTANVRDRDLGSFVQEAEKAIEEKVTIHPGYWIAWGGQFEHLISASKRLWIVVPISLALIFLMLFAAFGSMKNSLLIFSGIPLALTGGFFFLWARGIPLSISAAIGFIALSGIAVLNGMVMISFIEELRERGMALDEAICKGSVTRLRPVLMTALVASLGFIPMAMATGTGAEVQRPLATVVIGGIISSTILTLIVLPALYRSFNSSDE
ncbi:MAG: CusA/CzcA family heavy metal efflux RND transporter [Nitrospinae bacterium CG11_big_fil_rev_8_21_14_0_20_45_15]|nr:MAG: CusA/CzcA family heavy metal efflux RND transporter [Nitrospinae bacterium CG11_big_fil_rev_8_21_14_0_20_45_15]